MYTTVTVDGGAYTAADFGTESVDEWELEMETEEKWIRANRTTGYDPPYQSYLGYNPRIIPKI